MNQKIEGYIENIKDREKDNCVIFSVRVNKADVEKYEEGVTEALGDVADAVRELADAKKYLEKKQLRLKKIEKTGDKDDIVDARAEVREALSDVKECERDIKRREKEHEQAIKDLDKEKIRADNLRWTTGWITFQKAKY